MDNKKPVLLLALAITAFISGGFLLVVNVGMSGRKAQELHYDFGSFHGAAVAASSYFGDFERGGQILKKKSQDFMAGIFGGSAETSPASGDGVTAQRPPDQDAAAGQDAEGDAFEQYYKKHYAKDYGNGDSPDSGPGPASWADVDGGGSATGGGPGGSVGAAQGSSRETPKKGADAAAASSGAEGMAAAARTGFGGPGPAGSLAAAPRMYASLPAKGGPANNGQDYGGQSGPGGDFPASGNNKPMKGGALSGMPGGKGGAADLNGASEKMKSGGESSYKAQLAGGAKAAAAGGKAAPAASAAQQVSADGKTADKAGAAAGSGSKSGADDPGTSGGGTVAGPLYQPPDTSAADGQDLVASVALDRQKGAEVKYLSAEDAKAAPDETLLKAGALAVPDVNKDAAAGPAADDPADLASLPPERKEALKKEIHGFLKRVENKFGPMREIYATSCTATPELCKDHEVSGNYLTMTTDKGAKLVIGVKYVKGKWCRYTMDFKRPAGSAGGKPVAPPEEPADPSGDDEGDPAAE